MTLPIASDEQQEVIRALVKNNAVINSVAGSGKTTCILHIASSMKDINILLLTYNSKLKIETREKVVKLNITNLEVHSYHSFCVKYYYNRCYTDSEMRYIFNNKALKPFNYDLIILDEAQDITPLYYKLIHKIYKDNKTSAKICVLGDYRQSIYDFQGADSRFIEFADRVFNLNNKKWLQCKLPVSFRITTEMATFINKCLMKEQYIISYKNTYNKPRYIICNCFNDRPFKEVKYYLDAGYSPSDIFILAPSVKPNPKSPIAILENRIKNELKGINIYIPSGDNERLNERVLQNKLVFSSFHQTKGLERKVIIIFNFDISYFNYYKKDANHNVCPNEMYVAVTRGLEHLTVLHHYKNNYMPFIDSTKLSECCYIEGNSYWFKDNVVAKKPINTSVTELIKFMPSEIIDDCTNLATITKDYNYEVKSLDIPLYSENKDTDTVESISDITGVAIPSMYELKIKGEMSIYKYLTRSKKCPKQVDINKITPADLLLIANIWNAHVTGYKFKLYQVNDYMWLNEDILQECLDRLEDLDILKSAVFEHMVKDKFLNCTITGYIDCVDTNIVYEFKCVKEIKKEHYLQLLVYMYLYETDLLKKRKANIKKFLNSKKKEPQYKKCTPIQKLIKQLNKLNKETGPYLNNKYVLFNILTNDYINISCEYHILKYIVETLIHNKYDKRPVITDDDFKNKYTVKSCQDEIRD